MKIIKKLFFKIFIYILFVSYAYSDGLKITSFDDNSLTIDFANLEYEENDILTNEVKYNFIDIKEAQYLDIEGSPKLPYIETILGVPEDTEVEIEIINNNSKKLCNYNFYPSPHKIEAKTITGLNYIKEEFFKNESFYQQNKFYPEKIVEISKSFYLRDQKVVNIKFYPVQYNGAIKEVNLFEKIQARVSFKKTPFLKEFSIPKKDPFFEPVYKNTILNYDQSLKWRTGKKFGLMTQKMKDSENPLLKFKIEKSGLYKITYNDFKGAMPLGTEINKIKMYNNVYSMKNFNPVPEIPYFYSLPEKILSEYDNKENPNSEKCITSEPLKEINIYIYDENKNNKIDIQDYILFYGLGTEWFDYIEGKYYDHPYAKENFYWLSYKGEIRNLIEEIDGSILGNEEEIGETFESKIHFQKEKNNISDGIDSSDKSPFNIYWKTFVKEANFPFCLPFVDEKKEASILFSLTPITNIKCNINDKEIILSSNSGFMKGTIPINFLTTENNLVLKSNESKNIYCRYFEVEFAQKYEANDNILYFMNPNNKKNGIYKFLLKKFTFSQIEIFDITNPEKIKKIVNFKYNNGQVEFKDIFNNEKKAYIAIGFDKIISSDLCGTRDIGTEKILSKNKVDYLIITHPVFINELQRLKKHRETNPLIFEGIEENNPNVMIVSIFDIYDYFSYGLVDPVAIRNFLQYTLNFWDQTHKPAYVLLVGNCGYDFKGKNSEWNIIPSFYNFDKIENIVFYRVNLTDRWFVCFSDNFVPQMNIGRFCVQNPDELKKVIDKIEIFEKQKDFSEQRKRILLIGDDDEKPGKTISVEKEFWEDLENISNGYNDKKKKYIPLEYKTTKIYLKDYLKVWVGTNLLSLEVKNEIIQQINRGHLMAIYAGHGSPGQMADEDAFNTSMSTINALSNNSFPIFLTMTCGNGAVDNLHPQNSGNNWVLAKDMVKSEKKGAIAFLATTRNSYHSNNINFGKNFLTSFFYENKLGNEAKLIGKRTLGSAFTTAVINSNLSISNDFILSGDPGLIIGDLNAPLIKVFIDEVLFENMDYLPSNAHNLKIEAIDESGIKEIKIIDDGSINYYHSYVAPYPLQINLEPEKLPNQAYPLFMKNKDYNIIIEVIDVEGNKGIFTLQIATKFEIKNLINYPNPFKDNTTITYFISQIPDKVVCKIYTISGRLVQELENKTVCKSGYNTIFWDGKDIDGIKIGNGVYLYKIEAVKDDKTITSEIEKIVVLRQYTAP
ncbi:MAG: C25 family cysteine peptidase [bacterium]